MLFMLTLETLLLVALIIVVRSVERGTFSLRHLPLLLGLVAGVGALGLAFGLLEGATVRGDATNYTPVFVLACGLFCAIGFGIQTRRRAQALVASDVRGISIPFGVAVLSLFGSVYLISTAVDHWWFFRTSEAGVGSLSAFDESDVTCDVALIRLEEHQAVYRCPDSVMFNDRYSAPFIPWPHYQVGVSKRLKAKFDEMKQRAEAQSQPGE